MCPILTMKVKQKDFAELTPFKQRMPFMHRLGSVDVVADIVVVDSAHK